MFKTEDIEIDVDLSPGIYYLDSDSAVGKTRLLKLAVKLKDMGYPVSRYTYSDHKKGVPVSIMEHSDRLIVIDQYDMYPGELNERLLQLKDSAVILVDCKRKYAGLKGNIRGGAEVIMESAMKIKVEGFEYE